MIGKLTVLRWSHSDMKDNLTRTFLKKTERNYTLNSYRLLINLRSTLLVAKEIMKYFHQNLSKIAIHLFRILYLRDYSHDTNI